jgi:hypothetical protein
MSLAADRATTNYAAALLAFLDQPRPKPKPPLPSGPGRRKALGTVRHEGRLLKAIAEISLDKKTLLFTFAKPLRKRPEYRHLSERTLQRNVSEALTSLTDLLQACPPDLWQELFGIEPPKPPMTERKLRQKALELLRYQLMSEKQ